jgi:hypothetical protein
MRVVGITHRVKRTAEGESRPTMVAIIAGGRVSMLSLETEQDELDFVLGQFPIAWQNDIPTTQYPEGAFPNRFLHLRKIKQGDEVEERLIREIDGVKHRITAFAIKFDGLRHGDVVAMTLGGSGDCLAYALARQADKVGAKVLRIPPIALKARREAQPEAKEGDELLLAKLVQEKPDLFYQLAARDRYLIVARESWRALHEAMQARIACEQRLRQSFIGRIFTSPDGIFPEGGIEKAFDATKASNIILKSLQAEEAEREKDLVKAIAKLDVYTQVLSPITGVGPRIAARIIAAVVDIRRFDESAVVLSQSYARSEQHKIDGKFDEDADKVDRARYTNERSYINAVADWKNNQAEQPGMEHKKAEARHIYALLHEKRVRQKARQHYHGANNLKAFMGVHLMSDGTFPRKRRGQVANWHGDARQALYLLMDQFFKRPESEWGKRLRDEMALFRKKHPVVVLVENAEGKKVKKYNDLHIRKMAMWRTATKFVEWLYGEWLKLEPAPAQALPEERKAA